jgi:hypothetical protein
MGFFLLAAATIFLMYSYMKSMDATVEFNLLPSFSADEKIIYSKKRVWALTVKSLPTFRYFLSIPPLWDVSFYVTDKRIFIVGYLFRFLKFETSQWYYQENDNAELLKEFNIGRSKIFCSYLEVISENSVKKWYRSPLLGIRFFMKNPEDVYKIIAEAVDKHRRNDQQ